MLVVTVGVILTTLSSNHRQETGNASFAPTSRYLMGIGILTLALILSGLLGVAQDKTRASYAARTQKGTKPKAADPSLRTEAAG